jgi:hypothetical protein
MTAIGIDHQNAQNYSTSVLLEFLWEGIDFAFNRFRASAKNHRTPREYSGSLKRIKRGTKPGEINGAYQGSGHKPGNFVAYPQGVYRLPSYPAFCSPYGSTL